MVMTFFSWDDNKNQINIRKHGISFEEAVTVFQDENAILISDENHSDQEDRFLVLGESNHPHLLVVCHCYREGGTLIRIITARKADKQEREQYRGGAL
jgi:uncharacterized DUF497 family protein